MWVLLLLGACGTKPAGLDTDAPPEPRAFDLATLGHRIEGVEPGEELGAALSGVGDLNGDGQGDLLVGAPGARDAAGVAALFLSPHDRDRTSAEADAWIVGEAPTRSVGLTVSLAGDTDLDGAADLIVQGVFPDGGSVLALLPSPLSGEIPVSTATARILGGSEHPTLAVAAGRDLDDDGQLDLVVGSGQSDPPAVYVAFGPLLGECSLSSLTTVAEAPGDDEYGLNDGLGFTLALADTNGDGAVDVAMGAPQIVNGSGYVEVALGPITTGGLPSTVTLDGEAPDDLAGDALASAGDPNGDPFGPRWIPAGNC